jgi:hypothetical protein
LNGRYEEEKRNCGQEENKTKARQGDQMFFVKKIAQRTPKFSTNSKI